MSRRTGGGPTVSDVAREAGVSPMTVSRVVNNDRAVRSETRERVHAAIARLKYRPNAAARSLAGGARYRLALLYGNPSGAYLSEMLVGCLAQSETVGIRILLELRGDAEDRGTLAARLVAARLDGVILPPPFGDDGALIDALDGAGLAVATLSAHRRGAGLLTIAIDDRLAAFEMTLHLVALGHTRIGFVVGSPDQAASLLRERGYREALAASGLPIDPSLSTQGDFTYRSGLAAADRLLALARRPTAIFASNDDMAAGVMAAAHRRHLEVPGDLSVCGFDDTALATSVWPELTTVRQPVAAMAQAAVERLAARARARRTGERPEAEAHVFAHEIIRRHSDGAA